MQTKLHLHNIWSETNGQNIKYYMLPINPRTREKCELLSSAAHRNVVPIDILLE